MKLKRFLASLMAAAMLTTTVAAAAPVVTSSASNSDTSKYVLLDGDWHFKLYRTYSQMYQYFPYMPDLSLGNWEDAEAAQFPADDAWKSWDVIQMPYDNPETGGVLSHDLAPKWSESWVVREFDLPKNFTKDDTVTLLLGIIDDNDVVYINGTPVASSGFVDGNGTPVVDVPADGGFEYMAEAPEEQVKWKVSYWQVKREYTIPTEVLNLGGTNEIAIRVYNNNDYGGFYAGNIYALCGNESAVRYLKGLPTKQVTQAAVTQAAEAQNAALAAGDIDAYATTIAENYHNDAHTKADKVAEVKALMETYPGLTVTDADAAVYLDDEGNYWYSANRTIADAEGNVVSAEAVELCFQVSGKTAQELGNWNRCYATSYTSELFGQDLTYSVYLPPSYYEDPQAEYPTVWLLHGMNSSSSSFLNVDKIGAFMDEKIAAGKLDEMIVIMPDSGKSAYYQDSELGDNKDESGPWRTQLVTELRSVVEGAYRTINAPQFRGLTGISMGGFGSMSTGTSNPDVYSSVGVHMGYLPEQALADLKSLDAEQLANYDFYVDCGLQDTRVGTAGTIAVHDYLVSAGKEHGYDLRDGGHNSAFYMAGMGDSMKMHSDHFQKAMAFTDVVGDSTRGQIIKTLWKLAGSPAPKTAENPFSDVAENESILWAVENGIVSGYGNGTFGPDNAVTREQLAVILFNYAKAQGQDVSVGENTNILSYEDAFSVSEWAIPAVQWACGAGVMTDTLDGTLEPGAVAADGDAIQMLINYTK